MSAAAGWKTTLQQRKSLFLKHFESEDFSLLVTSLLFTFLLAFSWLFRGFFVALSWANSRVLAAPCMQKSSDQGSSLKTLSLANSSVRIFAHLIVSTAPAQKIFRELFLPEKILIALPVPNWGHFPGVLEPESFRTHSWNKQAQREVACGGSAWIFAFAARIRAWIPTKNGADFYSEAGVDFVWIFLALFSLSQKIHAKSMPESTPKSTQILKTFFPLVFWGAQPWFTSL